MSAQTHEIQPSMTMQEILTAYPSARRTIFQKYHIGGCATCGYALTETLQQIFVRNNRLDVLPEVIEEIYAGERRDGELQMAPVELKDALSLGEDWKIIDVREPAEAGMGPIENSIFLNSERALEILREWPKDTKMVFYCHVGIRSIEAAIYFQDRGFANVKSLKGGIDQWTADVDPSIPRY